MARLFRCIVGATLIVPALISPIGVCNQIGLPQSDSGAHGVSNAYVTPGFLNYSSEPPSHAVDSGSLGVYVNQLNKTAQAPAGEDWDSQVERGKAFHCYFSEKDIGSLPKQSTWTEADLQRWGWSRREVERVSFTDNGYGFLLPALRQGGVNVDNEQLGFVNWEHNEPYANPDEQHMADPSWARYSNLYAPKVGIIVVSDISSPAGMRRYNPDIVIPALSSWSDVTWLEWVRQCRDANVSPGDLKYVFHSAVVNPYTNIVAGLALENAGSSPSPWPGLDPDMDHDDGLAMLGTPNGRGTGWLLTTHRQDIQKKVSHIHYYRGGPGSNTKYMLLKLDNL